MFIVYRKVEVVMNTVFSAPAQIAIQGERVLRFIEFTGRQATYEIIGFEDPVATIIDHRSDGLLAIQSLLETGDLKAFAPRFNSPAMVDIRENETGELVIELNETDVAHPINILWVAIGIGSSIPVFEYIYENIRLLKGEKYALLSVYQASSEIPAEDSNDLRLVSSSASPTLSSWS
jgi:hypothetical protein